MLNRRMLRVKAFKVLYSYAEDQELPLKEALLRLDDSCEAVRDLYLYLLAVIPALTGEASRRIEAARSKFNPTEEDLRPNLRFVENRTAAILSQDPDFQKLIQKKKLSWEQYDVLIRTVYDSLAEKPWFKAYMSAPETSLAAEAKLFKRMFEEEFEDNEELWRILEDLDIRWTDDLPYALGCCIRTMDAFAASGGRWTLPELYTDPDADRTFVRRLLQNTYARYAEYTGMIAASVRRWESDRLFVTDLVLIAMGLAEAESFPEIPLRVTINEYVEISKYYSTPKSRSFVNGLLDALIKKLAAEGRVTKTVN